MENEENSYEEQIYPHIYPKVEVYRPTTPSINLELNGINEFLLEKRKLEERLENYKKINKKWTKADSGIKISCLTIAGVLTVAASVVGWLKTLILAPTVAIVTGVLGGFNAVQLFLSEGVSIGVTSKKKKIYREVCEQLELGINKLYLFQLKALEDKTTEEIEECQKIIKEINEKINGLKDKKKKDLS